MREIQYIIENQNMYDYLEDVFIYILHVTFEFSVYHLLLKLWVLLGSNQVYS